MRRAALDIFVSLIYTGHIHYGCTSVVLCDNSVVMDTFFSYFLDQAVLISVRVRSHVHLCMFPEQ